jgi:hypothetical protein
MTTRSRSLAQDAGPTSIRLAVETLSANKDLKPTDAPSLLAEAGLSM